MILSPARRRPIARKTGSRFRACDRSGSTGCEDDKQRSIQPGRSIEGITLLTQFLRRGFILPGLLFATATAGGSLDLSFRSQTNNVVRAFILQPDGRIVVSRELNGVPGIASGT